MDDNLFSTNTTESKTTNDSSSTTQTDNGDVDSLKRELDSLKKRLNDKDTFIETLKEETAGYRAELKQRMSLEEFLRQKNSQGTTTSTTSSSTETEKNSEHTTQRLSREDLEGLMKEVIVKEQSKAIRARNVEEVRREAEKTYGKDFVNKLKERAQELGVGPEFLNEVAASSPKAALNLLGVSNNTTEGKNVDFTPPNSSKNSASSQNQGGRRNKAYYDNLKATDKKTYWSPKIQAQMHKDALEQREAFYKS